MTLAADDVKNHRKSSPASGVITVNKKSELLMRRATASA